ncbi:beta-ketoacyl-[acyl-carrier-protein] synthase family protein [Methylophilus sp. 3sh_L]|uniref:beta-ketoacyl-[acyl-carrier-protein] synthase family protein n=1 Tax=Methylophilus sp. 3sh_L TaxID=3377114 RepID=UPI00398EC0E0
MSMPRRVVITGSGIVSPLGNDVKTFQQNLLNGVSGIGALKAEFAEQLETRIAAQCQFEPEQHFSRQELALLDRVSQFALYSAEQALQQSGIDLAAFSPDMLGCFIGTGMGGAAATEEGYARLFKQGLNRLKPFTVLMAMNSAAASQIATKYQLAGPNQTISTACSSAAIAIGEAAKQIAFGRCEAALAGGSEALLTFGTIKAWEALRTLAKEDPQTASASCKPFSADRTGLVLGEGAAVVVLETYEHARARGAHILAEIVGFGTSNDFSHMTQPSVEGQALAMQKALQDAGLNPAQIGYINAHGTGTQLNDVTETRAIKQVFGEAAAQIPVSSTKSMHGHLMGAAAAVELVASLVALQENTLPPTMHLNQPDPECDLNYVPNQAQTVPRLETVMSNSFAFGGTSGVLILRKI